MRQYSTNIRIDTLISVPDSDALVMIEWAERLRDRGLFWGCIRFLVDGEPFWHDDIQYCEEVYLTWGFLADAACVAAMGERSGNVFPAATRVHFDFIPETSRRMIMHLHGCGYNRRFTVDRLAFIAEVARAADVFAMNAHRLGSRRFGGDRAIERFLDPLREAVVHVEAVYQRQEPWRTT